jgi:aminoglycoside 2'-N-acetyltransferase I
VPQQGRPRVPHGQGGPADVLIRLEEAPPPGLRRLLDDAFAGAFTDDDWDHALGGVHVCAWEGEELIGHASVVARRLWLDGRELRCGYVEAVAVRAGSRRRGVGRALMDAAAPIIRGFDLGALSASDEGAGLYESCGWRPWLGPLHPHDDSVYVLGDVDRTGELTADRRAGDQW